MKIVILGDGLLGKELKKQTNWASISRNSHHIDFNDVTSCYKYLKEYDVIINCIAHTNTYDKNKDTHWAINYKAVSQLSDWCTKNNKKLVQISTDYVYANSVGAASESTVPVHANNWYSLSKLLGDSYIELKCDDYLIIRCGHKPNPFPYHTAFDDIIGNFDYVNVIASGIISLINHEAIGLYNVGTENKTMYDLAKETKPDVKKEYSREWMPNDVRMDCTKFKNKNK
jgi:dTDP-4-dehydrorhamnose reductase